MNELIPNYWKRWRSFTSSQQTAEQLDQVVEGDGVQLQLVLGDGGGVQRVVQDVNKMLSCKFQSLTLFSLLTNINKAFK